MSKRITSFKVIAFTLMLTVLLILGTACERLAPIEVENKTSEVLTVYIDECLIGDIKPDDRIENNTVFYGSNWYLIEAFNTQGNVVYSHRFSEEEIKAIDWKVVIQPP